MRGAPRGPLQPSPACWPDEGLDRLSERNTSWFPIGGRKRVDRRGRPSADRQLRSCRRRPPGSCSPGAPAPSTAQGEAVLAHRPLAPAGRGVALCRQRDRAPRGRGRVKAIARTAAAGRSRLGDCERLGNAACASSAEPEPIIGKRSRILRETAVRRLLARAGSANARRRRLLQSPRSGNLARAGSHAAEIAQEE